ncbi:MAG: hypothetical protein CMH83_01115 [Nocardioides sp.]|nr:hypothetical protein [Nocardioides sp.]
MVQSSARAFTLLVVSVLVTALVAVTGPVGSASAHTAADRAATAAGEKAGAPSTVEKARKAKRSKKVRNTARPRVRGTAAPGSTLTCSPGRWTGGATGFRYTWKRDGSRIRGAKAKRYRVRVADAGADLRCAVRPTRGRGARQASAAASPARTVARIASNTSRPSVVGTPEPGRTLTCDPGTWSDDPTFTYYWKRDGSPAGQGATFHTGSGPVGAKIVCSVAATTEGGYTTGRVDSAEVVIVLDADTTPTTPPTSAPVNTTRPSLTGTPAPGETLTCDPGSWTGYPTYAFSWTRNGSPAGNGTDTYAVGEGDLGATLVCLVSGSNSAGGSGAVASDGVLVSASGTTNPETSGPVNTSRPTVSGVPNPGWTLTCEPGGWEHNPTFTYSWTRDGSPTGHTAPTWELTTGDAGHTLVCLVVGTNNVGSSGAAQADGVQVVVPAAPTATTPPTITGTPEYAERLTCVSGDWTDHPYALAYTWVRDGVEIDTGETHGVLYSDIGRNLVCRVDATNAGGTTSAESAPVMPYPVNLTPPSITEGTEISGPADFRVDNELTCEPGEWTLNPHHAFTYTWTWQRAGADIADATEQTYTPTWDDADTDVTCTVTVTRLAVTSDPATSEPVRVLPLAPVAATAPVVTGTPEYREELTCVNGDWDHRPTDFSVRWIRDGVEIDTGDTHGVLYSDIGRNLVCEITGTNTGGSGTATSDPVMPYPVNLVAPSITGDPVVGSTLECQPGEWTLNPNHAFTYAWTWQRGGADIADATEQTYAAGWEDADTDVTCTVTVTRLAVTSDPATSAPVTVLPTAPANTLAPAISGSVAHGQTLTCTEGDWDNRPTSFTYQWNRDGSPVTGATEATHVLVTNDYGFEVTCTVTAGNTNPETGTATSDPVVMVPTPRKSPSVTGTLVVGETLTCDQALNDWNRGPGGTHTYQSFTWQRDTGDGFADIDGATTTTYVATWDDADADLTCSTVLTQRHAVTDPVVSDPVRVLPPAPVATTEPSLSPARPEAGEPLTCDLGTWANRPTSLTLQWLRGESAVGDPFVVDLTVEHPFTTVDRTVVLNDVAKPIACRVTATNTGGSGTATSAAVVPITTNLTPPSVQGTARTGDELTCDEGTWNKAPGSYAYTWTRDGATVDDATARTYLTGVDHELAEVACTVVLTRGGVDSDPATSDPVTVLPWAPQPLTAPAVSPTDVVAGDTVTCDPGTWEGDPSYAFAWTRDGVGITGADAATYDVTAADVDTVLACVVDGSNAGGTTTSRSAEVVPAATSLTAPTVSGLAAPGETLTCEPGTWDAAGTSSYAWQRLAGGWTAIAGADEATYDVEAGDADSVLRCRETLTTAVHGVTTTAASEGVFVDRSGSGALVAAFPLDGGAGGGFGGAATNYGATPTADRFGVEDGALLFGGDGDYVQTDQPSNTLPLSFSVWFRPDSTTGQFSVVDSDVASKYGHNLVIGYFTAADGELDVMYHNGHHPTGTFVEVGQWYQAVVTYGTHITLYVDGVEVFRTPYAPAYPLDGSTFRIGAHSNGNHPFDGAIDDVQFFDAELTAEQAGALYDPPAPGSVTAPAITPDTDVVEGDELTCSEGTWTYHPTLSFAWERDGSTIAGADQATYTTIADDVDTDVTCTVTGTNAGGSTGSTSAAIAVSAAPVPAPTNTVAPSISGEASEHGVLTCDPGTWSESDGFTYAWQRGGADIAGAATADHTVAYADEGEDLTCTVTTTVGGVTSDPAVSAPVTVSTDPQPITWVPDRWDEFTVTQTGIAPYSAAVTVGGDYYTDVFVDGTVTEAGRYRITISDDVTDVWAAGADEQHSLTVSDADLNSLASADDHPYDGTLEVTFEANLDVGDTLAVAIWLYDQRSGPSLDGDALVTIDVERIGDYVAPVTNTSAPSISPSTDVVAGDELTCDPGTWTGEPAFGFSWERDGSTIAGADQATYTTIADDVDTDLTCTVTGSNAAGQDQATSASVTVASAVQPLDERDLVTGGYRHTVVIDRTGQLHAWGRNDQGQVGQGSTGANVTAPARITTFLGDAPDAFIDVAASWYTTAAVDSTGVVWTWGSSSNGALGRTGTNHTPGVVGFPADAPRVVDVAAGQNDFLALDEEGQVWTWGSTANGKLGRSGNATTPGLVDGFDADHPIVRIGSGAHTSYAIDDLGRIWSWGGDQWGQDGRNGASGATPGPITTTTTGNPPTFVDVTGGYYHAIALDDAGRAWSWGASDRIGRSGDRTVPGWVQPAGSPPPFTGAAAGGGATLLLDASGRVWSFGPNPVHSGHSSVRPQPTQVNGLSGGSELGSGVDHAVARVTSGDVWTWGSNQHGQLGRPGGTTYVPGRVTLS